MRLSVYHRPASKAVFPQRLKRGLVMYRKKARSKETSCWRAAARFMQVASSSAVEEADLRYRAMP